MIKVVFCLRRRAGMSRAEFQAYWRDVHAPLVVARAKILGIDRYVQCHTLDDSTFAKVAQVRGGAAPFDGVAEIWQSEIMEGTVEARRQAAKELLADEANFIDLAASPLFFTQEHEVVSPAALVGRDDSA